MRGTASLCVYLATVGLSVAESNIDANNAFSWSRSAGWFNWYSNSENGARIDEFVCGGFVYGANVGWINLGSGFPANGIQYLNDSSTDFGVNLDSVGNLRGFAYGANVGWIEFNPPGEPRINLDTGRLSGFAYSANMGWMNLGEFTSSTQIESFGPGTDNDSDGIPDAWERKRTGTLTALHEETDSDNDGLSDVGEYQADTDPLDPDENLQIVRFALTGDGQSVLLGWTARGTRFYTVQMRSQFEEISPWTNMFPALVRGTDEEVSILVTNAQNSSHNYFRVQAVRPLQPTVLTE